MAGCDNITAGKIDIFGNTMSMTITNPHDPVTVLNVQVAWNASSGGSESSVLTLQYASLGTQFWTGSDTSGDLVIKPSTTIFIPGNNAISTIVFTFDKAYENPGTTFILINLSTPGCESLPIQSP